MCVCALLCSYFSATELKNLRVCVSAFLEMLAMATETMAQFVLSDSKHTEVRKEHAATTTADAAVAAVAQNAQ